MPGTRYMVRFRPDSATIDAADQSRTQPKPSEALQEALDRAWHLAGATPEAVEARWQPLGHVMTFGRCQAGASRIPSNLRVQHDSSGTIQM
jgi:hypothetical protein